MARSRSVLLAAVALALAGAAQAQVTIAVDAASARCRIDPDVYGIHYSTDAAFASGIRQPLRRWGGNDSSRYNWTINAFNNGVDYNRGSAIGWLNGAMTDGDIDALVEAFDRSLARLRESGHFA